MRLTPLAVIEHTAHGLALGSTQHPFAYTVKYASANTEPMSKRWTTACSYKSSNTLVRRDRQTDSQAPHKTCAPCWHAALSKHGRAIPLAQQHVFCLVDLLSDVA